MKKVDANTSFRVHPLSINNAHMAWPEQITAEEIFLRPAATAAHRRIDPGFRQALPVRALSFRRSLLILQTPFHLVPRPEELDITARIESETHAQRSVNTHQKAIKSLFLLN
tara:strand:+ start:965 stop:1300 length:336 start_codon:yes stop_codon:yes gene_type:complete